MDMPQPGPGHLRMEKLAKPWEGEENMHPSQWDPKGGVAVGSPPEVFVGRFDGDILSLAHGGPGMHVRMTYDLSDPENLRTRMEMSQDGADWNTLFDGSYKRI